MQTVHESTTAHVRRAVCHHEFVDAGDWASGLDKLAGFTDAEIDALAHEEPSDLIIFPENRPLTGVTPAQQQTDRELFQRRSGLLRTAMLAGALLGDAAQFQPADTPESATYAIRLDRLLAATKAVGEQELDAGMDAAGGFLHIAAAAAASPTRRDSAASERSNPRHASSRSSDSQEDPRAYAQAILDRVRPASRSRHAKQPCMSREIP